MKNGILVFIGVLIIRSFSFIFFKYNLIENQKEITNYQLKNRLKSS